MVNLLKSFDHPPEKFGQPPEKFGHPPEKFSPAQAGTTWGLAFAALYRLCQSGQDHRDFVQNPESFVQPTEKFGQTREKFLRRYPHYSLIHSCHQSEGILHKNLPLNHISDSSLRGRCRLLANAVENQVVPVNDLFTTRLITQT